MSRNSHASDLEEKFEYFLIKRHQTYFNPQKSPVLLLNVSGILKFTPENLFRKKFQGPSRFNFFTCCPWSKDYKKIFSAMKFCKMVAYFHFY